MKRTIFALILAIVLHTSSAFAQQSLVPVTTSVYMENVSAKIKNSHLVINWNCAAADNNYYEVQGSIDGKLFYTLGMVLGEDPSANNKSFSFKLSVEKLKKGVKYFRVLQVDPFQNAVASNTIRISK